ncbi:hypothetical protein QYE76_045267 [Lolium multiflorum]|uniref:Uncharacterized protein n=1 Tax=Lolium multiflorum TaxID=4521 RepID=A0AAD8TMM1_LOLMU|nr:hypothetical protein QYE76_045267 [Lolium multiflorum]
MKMAVVSMEMPSGALPRGVPEQRLLSPNLGFAMAAAGKGPLPPAPSLDSFPVLEEALRVTDEFCDQYRALRREVEILQEENYRLRRMLERFLTPIEVVPSSTPPPKE